MRIKIKDIAYYLPEQTITNEDLLREQPTWDMKVVEERSGVVKRHVARDNETAFDLALRACERLFANEENRREQIDGIIFCTQSPDYVMPANSFLLHKALDLPENVFVLDFNHACSGYIYGLALGQALIQSDTARNILLVNADTYSKYIHSQDRSARVLFGDGAAATLLVASETSAGIVDIQCSTGGKEYEKFMIPAGACRIPKSPATAAEQVDKSGNVRTLEHIHMDGMGILVFVNSKIPKQVNEILTRNQLSKESISLYVFHQASKMALDSLTRLLGLKPSVVMNNLRDVGNTVSASIPIALKDALDGGKLKRGDKTVLCGFGVGLSWGTAILEI